MSLTPAGRLHATAYQPALPIQRVTSAAQVPALVPPLCQALEQLGVYRWLVRDPTRRRRILAAYLTYLLEDAITSGTVWTDSDAVSVAVWLPDSSPESDGRLADIAGLHESRFRTLHAALHAAYPADEPVYLRLLGVDLSTPTNQRLGSTLLADAHRRHDQDRLAAVAVAASLEEVGLLSVNGYTVRGAPIALGTDDAVLYAMRRDPVPPVAHDHPDRLNPAHWSP
jgi:hypothetical protein